MSDSSARRFEALVRPHLDQLYRVAFRLTGNVEDTEDLIQDLLVKLYPRRQELERVELLRPWLTRVMYNLFIDGRRRYGRSPVRLVEPAPHMEEQGDPFEQVASDAPGPDAAIEREQRLEEIAGAFRRLSEDHRLVITLHDIEGYTLAEIQAILDCPIGTLKSRLHRARARLRELIEEGTF